MTASTLDPATEQDEQTAEAINLDRSDVSRGNGSAADDYIFVMQKMANDPDADLSAWDRDALAPFSKPGAFTILRERSPLIVSVDSDFIRKASSC